MRLRLGGSVIFLERKHLRAVVFLLATAVVGLLYVMTRSDATSDDDDEYFQPAPIDRFLRNGRQDGVDDSAVGKGGRGHGRLQLDGDRMAMDEARARRGADIAAARSRLIAGLRRAPDWRYNINVTLSDLTSPDRHLPDTRPPVCHSLPYYDASKGLPTATVIIPFYNEALTMLLRAVHSVLNRSPDKLLDEVILVDDCSTDVDLKKPLADYLRLLPKVRLLRHDTRKGLMVSRMNGARSTQSQVLFFLDAHAEVNAGWLEPLLDELQRDPKQVLQPFVDGIDAMTLTYHPPGVFHKGSFSWDLRYTWIRVKEHEQRQADETGLPFPSPTLVGCAIAVDRDYFMNLGAFDEGMRIWGGENIELGFRTWMCGGRVNTVTCSRVGHVFKEFPYQFDGDKEEIVQKNLMRVAETWMDGMRKYFYASTRVYSFKRAELTDSAELESLETRKRLRQRLQCRNFEWFMYNIIPEVPIPPMNAVLYGEIKNSRSEACWEATPDYFITMTNICYHHKIIPENHFALTVHGRMMLNGRCVDVPRPPHLELVECRPDSTWRWELKRSGPVWGSLRLSHFDSTGQKHESCIAQVTNAMPEYRGHQMPQVMPCDDADPFQQWSFTYAFDFSLVPQHTLA